MKVVTADFGVSQLVTGPRSPKLCVMLIFITMYLFREFPDFFLLKELPSSGSPSNKEEAFYVNYIISKDI